MHAYVHVPCFVRVYVRVYVCVYAFMHVCSACPHCWQRALLLLNSHWCVCQCCSVSHCILDLLAVGCLLLHSLESCYFYIILLHYFLTSFIHLYTHHPAADYSKVWLNRKAFLMFLSTYQFLYASALTPENPVADNSIHTCFYSKDICWSISQFLLQVIL